MNLNSCLNQNLVSIVFELEGDEWHGHNTETLWALEVSDGNFRLENTPFFVKGSSFEDIVLVRRRNQHLVFEKTLIYGGHSTYRVILDKLADREDILQHWEPLEAIGCTYESGDFGYEIWAIDVPLKTDVRKVYGLLNQGEEAGVWDFEEGHFGHSIEG